MGNLFHVIHLEETDGDIKIGVCINEADVERYVRVEKLTPDDYAVIEGEIKKDFHG